MYSYASQLGWVGLKTQSIAKGMSCHAVYANPILDCSET